MLRHLLAPLMFALLLPPALAEDVRVYGQGEAVNPDDVARILSRSPAAAPKMRSLRLLDDTPSAAATAPASGSDLVAAASPSPAAAYAAEAAAPAAPATSALALPVQFSFNSADILPAARPQLDALAEGIRRLPDVLRVTIEGHTDAVGSDQYNRQLSLRRAHAVQGYLVAVHHIDPSRLRAVGLGEYMPLAGLSPDAPQNRRVQFRGE
jgi:outer membrane protein OmpA-like peptidoglycan-associated protein